MTLDHDPRRPDLTSAPPPARFPPIRPEPHVSKTLAIEFDDDICSRLEHLARRTDRSPAAVVESALRAFLDREESEAHESGEDQARWDRFRATGVAIPHDDVARWLDSYTPGAQPPCPR